MIPGGLGADYWEQRALPQRAWLGAGSIAVGPIEALTRDKVV